MVIKPQYGFQYDFLNSTADIVIGGGSAGSGKTFASLLLPLFDYENPNFGAVFFRRTYSQIKNTGGLWDESKTIYHAFRAKPNETNLEWVFPSGSSVKFSHLQHEKDIYSHQGAQYPLIIFDELTHFSETMFWYLLSRNRSTCGVKPKIRATCNPDPESFVARLISWWIDTETGLPMPGRSGKIRFFLRESDNIIWGDTKEEVIKLGGHILSQIPSEIKQEDLIKSITFIPGSIYDNKKLLKINPEYLSNLLSQDENVRQQLLEGNWKVKQDDTCLYQWDNVQNLFTNFMPGESKERYIVTDAARYGRDLNVTMVFVGWEVVFISILKKSDVHDVVNDVEDLRQKFKVSKSNCLVDGDGVGGDAVKLGGYKSFNGGRQPMRASEIKENYKNLKTQCAFFLAEKIINLDQMRINVLNSTCRVDGVLGTKLKIDARLVDIRDLITEDLRAIKYTNVDGEGKKQINTKEEQKIILGRSPDFFDCLNMKVYFELIPKNEYL